MSASRVFANRLWVSPCSQRLPSLSLLRAAPIPSMITSYLCSAHLSSGFLKVPWATGRPLVHKQMHLKGPLKLRSASGTWEPTFQGPQGTLCTPDLEICSGGRDSSFYTPGRLRRLPALRMNRLAHCRPKNGFILFWLPGTPERLASTPLRRRGFPAPLP